LALSPFGGCSENRISAEILVMLAASELPRDPDQIRELELLRRGYEAQMLASRDPAEKRRLYAIMKQIEESIARLGCP
jgi:hypothetical protein